MASGDYDRHLKRLLPVLKQNTGRMTAAVQLSFPPSPEFPTPGAGRYCGWNCRKKSMLNSYLTRPLPGRFPSCRAMCLPQASAMAISSASALATPGASPLKTASSNWAAWSDQLQADLHQFRAILRRAHLANQVTVAVATGNFTVGPVSVIAGSGFEFAVTVNVHFGAFSA